MWGTKTTNTTVAVKIHGQAKQTVKTKPGDEQLEQLMKITEH